MGQATGNKRKVVREFTQLLRIQERLLGLLQDALAELGAPTTLSLLRDLRNRTGSSGADSFGRVANSVEGAVRELKLFESEIQKELMDSSEEINMDGVPDLPAPLARFLAERSQGPHFSYQVRQDPVRGWIISWREYTEQGMIRAYGQLYERPYAWLDE